MPSKKLLQVESAGERNQREFKGLLEEIAGTMNLPGGMVEAAMGLYFLARKNQIPFHGAEKKTAAAALLFIACRKRNLSRSFKEFEEATSIPTVKLGKMFFKLTKGLELDVDPAKAQEFVARFCSELRLAPKIQMLVTKAVRNVEKKHLANGTCGPIVAAAVTYIVAYETNEERTLKEVSKVTKTSVAVLRKTCQKLNEEHAKLMDGVRLK